MQFHINIAPPPTPYDFVASVAVYAFRTNVAAFYIFCTSPSKASCSCLCLVQIPTNFPVSLVSRTISCQMLPFLTVSGTHSSQSSYTDSRDRGSGGTRSKHFPSSTRGAFVLNAIVRSLSHGEVTCHRPWTSSLVYQDLNISQETPILKFTSMTK